MAHDVFLSHASKDKLTADAICHSLEHNGIRCWIAPRDVRVGANYGAEIIRGIRDCKVLILIFSASSNMSKAVHKEVETAFSNGKTIIPFRIEKVKISDDLSFYIAGNHWLDAYPNDNLFEGLVNNVIKILGMSITKPVVPSEEKSEKSFFSWLIGKNKTRTETTINPPVTTEWKQDSVTTKSLSVPEQTSIPAPIAQSPIQSVTQPAPKPETKPILETERSTSPLSPITVNLQTKPVYSPEDIPENAVKFVPRGTAYILLENKTRYIVTANSLMYQRGSRGMIHGFPKGEKYDDIVPFTAMKRYANYEVLDEDGEKIDVITENGILYFLELQKKKTPTMVKIQDIESIDFDWSQSFDSIVYYALLEQVEGPPLVVPSTSMFIAIFGISTFGGPYTNYKSEIPFPNEENVSLKRIKRFEIAAVTHIPSGYDHTCKVEIIVETNNGEILRDKIHNAISLCFLSKKGISDISLHKIKRYTILDPSPERLTAITPAVSVFPSEILVAQEDEVIPKTIIIQPDQIHPFHSKGTVRIEMEDGAEYFAPANTLFVMTWGAFYSGIKENYSKIDSPLFEFLQMKQLTIKHLPKDPNKYYSPSEYIINKLDGSTNIIESEDTSIIFPQDNKYCTLQLPKVTSIDFDWDHDYIYDPELVTILQKDMTTVSFPKSLFFIGHKYKPSEDASGWSNSINFIDGFITDKKQTIQTDQLKGVQFLIYRMIKYEFKNFKRWMKKCKVEFEYLDERKFITDLGMDSIHLHGINDTGEMEIYGENVEYIYFNNKPQSQLI